MFVKLIAFTAGGLAIGLFLLEFVVLISTDFVLRVVCAYLLGRVTHRKKPYLDRRAAVRLGIKKIVARWFTFWGAHLRWWTQKVLSFKFVEDVPAELFVNPGEQFIFVANHQNSYDGIAFLELARKLRLLISWIGKEEMFDAPIVGWALLLTDAACVTRRRDPMDLERIKVSAELAMRDGFSAGILPEGHRSGSGQIGEAKTGGFVSICSRMRGKRIIAAKIHYPKPMRTMWGVRSLFRARITLQVRVYDKVTELPAEKQATWLRMIFAKMKNGTF